MSGIPRRALRPAGWSPPPPWCSPAACRTPTPERRWRGRRRRERVVDGGSADGDKVVTILGAFGGDEEKNFNASLAEFEKSSGIDVKYTSDQDFTTTIKQKVSSGDSPDIGLFPQPGGMLEFAAQRRCSRSTPTSTTTSSRAPCSRASSTPAATRAASTAPRCATPSRASSGTPRPPTRRPRLPKDPATIQDAAHRRRRQDRRDGHHPVVHRLGVRPGHRLGGHRLGRGAHAAHVRPDRLRRLDLAPHAVQRRARRQGPRRGRQVQQGPGDGPRRHQGRAQHRLRRRHDPGLREAAEVHAAPPGQLRHDLLPEERPGRPRQPGRHLRLPEVRGRLRRPGDPRWRRPRGALQRQRPRRPEGHGSSSPPTSSAARGPRPAAGSRRTRRST